MTAVWVDVCAASEMSPGTLRRIDVPGHAQPVLLARVADEFFAVGGECTHRRLPLEGGRIVGEDLVCPWHRGRFSLRTGRARALPATAPLPVYDVRLDANRILMKTEGQS